MHVVSTWACVCCHRLRFESLATHELARVAVEEDDESEAESEAIADEDAVGAQGSEDFFEEPDFLTGWCHGCAFSGDMRIACSSTMRYECVCGHIRITRERALARQSFLNYVLAPYFYLVCCISPDSNDSEEDEDEMLDEEVTSSLRPGLRPRRAAQAMKRSSNETPGSTGRAKRSRRARKVTEFYEPPVASSAPREKRETNGYRRRSSGRSQSSPRHSRHKRLSLGARGGGHSTTEDEWDDRDDRYFEARRAKSEHNARSRIRPMNMPENGAFTDRLRAAPKVSYLCRVCRE